MDSNEVIKEKVRKELNEVLSKLTDLREGYLEKFEDEDPVASVKGEIDSLIDDVNLAIYEIDDLFDND
jgi:hypothetical protein